MITEFGGAVAVPSAVRNSDSTTTMRVNDVIMVGFLIFAFVLTGMMATYLNYFMGVMHELTPLK